MHEVLVNRLGGLSLPRKSVVRLTDRPDMTLDVYRRRKTTIQQQLRHEQNECHMRCKGSLSLKNVVIIEQQEMKVGRDVSYHNNCIIITRRRYRISPAIRWGVPLSRMITNN